MYNKVSLYNDIGVKRLTCSPKVAVYKVALKQNMRETKLRDQDDNEARKDRLTWEIQPDWRNMNVFISLVIVGVVIVGVEG